MVQEVTHFVSQYVDVATAAPASVHPGVSLRIVPFMAVVTSGLWIVAGGGRPRRDKIDDREWW